MRRARLEMGLAGLLTWCGCGIAWAQERPDEWGWGMHPMTWMWGAWGISAMLVMLLFWGLVVAALVAGIRWLVRSSGNARPDTALDILRQRYARGEINREEFEAKKRDLG
jgi:putative membrane protein